MEALTIKMHRSETTDEIFVYTDGNNLMGVYADEGDAAANIADEVLYRFKRDEEENAP